MATDNSDQEEYWNGAGSDRWIRNMEDMERTLSPFSDHVLHHAAPAAGERVLDIGCGCGGTTLKVAARVGADGHVTGIDISRPMLAAAQRIADSHEHGPQTRFVAADASEHDLEHEDYDLLFSRFGVMFFADPDAAFARIGRSLRPGGRVALACWRRPSDNPWMMVPVMVAKDFVELPPRPGPEEPGPFSFSDPDRVRRILTAAGFEDIALDPFDHPMVMGPDPATAVDTVMEIGPVGGAAEQLDAAGRERLRAALAERLADHHGPEGVALQAGIWRITSRKA